MRPTCLISDQDGRQFAYNRAGRLSEVKHQGRTIAHYTYNALSQRTAKQTDHRTTLYQYDQTGNLLGESTPAGIPLRDYVYRDTLPVAQIHHQQGSDGRGAQPFAGEHPSASVDVHMQEGGYRMVRYADDFVVLCESQDQAQRALHEIRTWMERNGLSLHPDKTRVGDCRIEGQGFEFLGYRFECGKRWVRGKSVNALRDAIRRRTSRVRGAAIERVITDLNPILKGWFGYFKHAQRYTFGTLDAFVRRRLRAILLKQNKCEGLGNSPNHSQRWPNAFFAEQWAFHDGPSPCDGEPISMKQPPTGEPCAGEPPARFGGRGGESLSDPYQQSLVPPGFIPLWWPPISRHP